MPLFRVASSIKTLALASALALATTALNAAPRDGTQEEPEKKPKSVLELKIPIPHEVDAANNGCRLRASPAEAETGALTEVPFWRLIVHDNLIYRTKLLIGGQDGLAAALKPLDEDARTLAMLYVLHTSLGRDGLHTLFYLESGDMAPLMRDTLKAAGLAREHNIFSRAMALFGKDYPTDREVRKNLFGWSKPSKRVDATTSIPAALNSFDHALMALGKEFGGPTEFYEIIVGWVETRPALWQQIEARRQNLNEPDRLAILTDLLWYRMGNLWRPYPEVEQRLTLMGKQHRNLAVIAAFNEQFRNGGVHQFFYNSEGSLAPDVHEAMLVLGMTEQAAIFKRGLDMFRKPYLRDTTRRRETAFGHDGWTNWDKKLSALTDEFYDLNGGLSFHRIKGNMIVEGGPGIDFAMRKYARENKLLPC
jgi:hypothetical protein